MKLRNTLQTLVGAILAATLPVVAIAQTESNSGERCLKDQYVLWSDIPALKGKAVAEISSLTSQPLQAKRSSQRSILVAPNTQSLRDQHQLVVYKSQANLCDKLKIKQRKRLRSARSAGKLTWVRRYSCSCNAELKVLQTPNDPSWTSLWGLNQSVDSSHPADVDMNLPQAWNMCVGSSNTVVAIIDTGMDYNHPDLAANVWTNPGEIAGNGIDDDGNGYIDDIHGANMITRSGNPFDDHGHGTHVAGTIGAVGNNGVGVVGVNWQVKMLALKFLSSTGSGNTADAIAAVEYATALKNRGINVVATNNSWGGGGFSTPLYNAIANAKLAGILFVAAAGNSNNNNDTNPSYPSNYPLANVIAVAATDSAGNKAYFSSYGQTTVHIAAPGVGINSTTPSNTYSYFNGTSMATPHVTGALALLKSFAVGMNWSDLKDTLLNTARPLPGLTGFVATGGIADAAAMLQDALDKGRVGPTPTPTPSPTPTRTPTPTPTRTPTPTPTMTPTTAPGYFNISGRVTDGTNVIANAKIILNYGGTQVVQYTTQNGDYFFNNVYGPVDFTLTVVKGGMTFVTQSSTLTRNVTLPVVGAWKQYTVGFNVLNPSGIAVPGVAVDGGSLGLATTNAQGRATFNVSYGKSYTLAPSIAGYTFSQPSLSGEVEGDVERLMIANPN